MTWSPLQSASKAATSSAVSSVALAYSTNLTSGTKLIAAVSTATQTHVTTSPYAIVSTVEDGAANSFTLIGHIQYPSATDVLTDVSLWAMDTPSGDVGTKPTITATLGGGTANMGILVQEVSGLLAGNTAAMVDGTIGVLGGTAGSSTGSPSYTSAAADEYLVSVYGDDGGPVTWTKPPALTSDANSLNSQSYASIALAYGNSTDGTEAGSWALSGTSGVDWGTLLAAFKLGSTTVSGTATAAGAGSVSAAGAITFAVTGGAAGHGSVSALGTIPGTGEADGAGSVTALAGTGSTGEADGAGTAGGAPLSGWSGEADGAGSVSTAVTRGVIAAAAGDGSVTAKVRQHVVGTVTGAGSVTAGGHQRGAADVGGASSVTADATNAGTASAAGAGSATPHVTIGVTAEADGTGRIPLAQAGVPGIVTAAAASSVATTVTVTMGPSDYYTDIYGDVYTAVPLAAGVGAVITPAAGRDVLDAGLVGPGQGLQKGLGDGVTAKLFGADDKLSTSGGTMSGTLVFQGTPPFTVVSGLYAGTVTLNGTTAVVVDTAAVDSGSLIFLTPQPTTAPVGIPYVSAVSAGTSFSVKSTSNSDTAVVLAWFIVEAT